MGLLKGEDRSLSDFKNKLRNTSERDKVRQMESFEINKNSEDVSATAFTKVNPKLTIGFFESISNQ